MCYLSLVFFLRLSTHASLNTSQVTVLLPSFLHPYYFLLCLHAFTSLHTHHVHSFSPAHLASILCFLSSTLRAFLFLFSKLLYAIISSSALLTYFPRIHSLAHSMLSFCLSSTLGKHIFLFFYLSCTLSALDI